ncbi:hypothetical protein ACSN7O_004835, partial [Enterobacter chuandaensis]
QKCVLEGLKYIFSYCEREYALIAIQRDFDCEPLQLSPPGNFRSRRSGGFFPFQPPCRHAFYFQLPGLFRLFQPEARTPRKKNIFPALS